MYAKAMIDYVSARAVTGGWSRYLYSTVPVVMALTVATLPFVTHRDALGGRSQPQSLAVLPLPMEMPMHTPPSTLMRSVALPNMHKRVVVPLDQRQHVVADYITRKYGVSSDVVGELVRTAFAAGKQYGIDPMLVVAMMGVESSFNPIAESMAGAKGLMQIIPRYHPEKFMEYGGEQSVFDPRVNIVVGARILREYLLAASGNLFVALQTYAGALTDQSAAYSNRVLNEKDQLDDLAGLPKTDRGTRLVQIDPMGTVASVALGVRLPTVSVPPVLPALTPAPPLARPDLPSLPLVQPASVAAPATPPEEARLSAPAEPPAVLAPAAPAPAQPVVTGSST